MSRSSKPPQSAKSSFPTMTSSGGDAHPRCPQHRCYMDDPMRFDAPEPKSSAAQTPQLFGTIADAMAGVLEKIKPRPLVQFHRADPAYGKGAPGSGSLSTR